MKTESFCHPFATTTSWISDAWRAAILLLLAFLSTATARAQLVSHIDYCKAGIGSVCFGGWVYDKVTPHWVLGREIEVSAIISNKPNESDEGYEQARTAEVEYLVREDVNSVYHLSGMHGFRAKIDLLLHMFQYGLEEGEDEVDERTFYVRIYGTVNNGNGFEDILLNAPYTALTIRKNLGDGVYSPFIILNAADWNVCADAIADNDIGDYFSGCDYQLGDDYYDYDYSTAVSKVFGTANRPFSGHFDGRGQTLKVDINNASGAYAAPFNFIENATISELKVIGSVKGGIHTAGLVGGVGANSTNVISSCWVNANITVNGTHGGGIIGHGSSSNTTVTDCLFDGSLSGPTEATGVILGYHHGGHAYLNNCYATGTISGSGIDLARKNSGIITSRNSFKSFNSGDYGIYTTATGSQLQSKLGDGWAMKGNRVVPAVFAGLGGQRHIVKIGEGLQAGVKVPTLYSMDFSLTQQLYTADEIGTPGTITSIAFKNTGVTQTRTLDVYLVATNKTRFASATDWMTVNDSQLAYSGPVEFVSGQWTDIELDIPFEYEGSSSLAIIVNDKTDGHDGNSPMTFSVCDAAGQAICFSDDSAINPASPPAEGYAIDKKNQLKVGITVDRYNLFVSKPTDLTYTTVPVTGAVTLSWDENDTATEWQICLNDDESQLITVNDEQCSMVDGHYSMTLTELTPGTAYTAKVRAVRFWHGSSWSTPVTFIPTNACALTVNDGTDIDSDGPVDGSHVNQDAESQFIISSTELADMAYSTINRLTFYSPQPSFSWDDAQFDVYMKEVDFDEFTDGNMIDWASMEKVVSVGRLFVSSGKMEVVFDKPFTYMDRNLLIGFRQVANGSSYGSSWFGTMADGNMSLHNSAANASRMVGASTMAKAPRRVITKQAFLPKATIYYQPDETPSCVRPTNLKVSNVKGNTAVVSWLSNASAWNIEVNDALVSNPQVTNDGGRWSYTLTGLELDTDYKVRVQADCGAGGTSEWTAPVSFTTEHCLEEDMCVISYELHDSYGDSWNGNSIQVVDAETGNVIDTWTISDYTDTATGILAVCRDSKIQFVWVKGDYAKECSFTIYDVNGEVICQHEKNDTGPTSGVLENYSVDCTITNCKRPTGLTLVSAAAPKQAELTWMPGSDEQRVWQLCINGDQDNLIEVTETSYTLIGLTPETTYTVMVRGNCGEEKSNWSNLFTFTTATACPVPTGLAATDVSFATASLNWEGLADSYEVSYAAFQSSISWLHHDNGTYSTSFGNNKESTRTWGVMYSGNLVTDNSLTKIAFYEDSRITSDITVNIYSGGDDAPGTLLHTEVVTRNGKNGFREVYLSTPVAITSGQNLWITFTANGSYIMTASLLNECTPYSQWIFYGGEWLHLSDLDSDFANYSWMIRGGTQTIDFDALSQQGIPVSGKSYQLTGLNPETSYLARVRGNYGTEGSSKWTATMFTTTEKNPIPKDVVVDASMTEAVISWAGYSDSYKVRYRASGVWSFFDDFEDGLNKWTLIDADGDGYNWDLASNVYNSTSYSGFDMAVSSSYSDDSPLTPDNFLVSPKLALGGIVSFWACAQDAKWPSEHFGVAVSTAGNTNPSDFTMVAEWDMTASRQLRHGPRRVKGQWYKYTVDLSNYAGQEGYIALRHFGCTDFFYLNVDDFFYYNSSSALDSDWTVVTTTNTSVTLTGLMPETHYEYQIIGIEDGEENVGTDMGIFTTDVMYPVPTNLDVTDIGCHSATLNWTAGDDNQTNWDIGYKMTGETDYTVVEGITANPHTLTGLLGFTEYRVAVRGNYGSGNTSKWSRAVLFTTQEEFLSPTELMVKFLTGTTATLSWKAGTDEEAWQIAYSTDADFNPETEGVKVTASENPFTLNGLSEGITYYAALRADHGEGRYSRWTEKVSFVPKNELTVYEGTKTNWHVPLNVYDFEKNTRSQFVIPATDLEDLEGCTITGLKFYTNYDSEFTTDVSVDVYLTEVSERSISDYVDKTDATIVYQGTLSNVPVDWRSEVTITFTTPYLYKGGNLLVGSENTSKGTFKILSFYGVEVLGASIAGSNYSGTGAIRAEQQNFIPKTTIFYQPDDAAIKKPYHFTASNVTSHSAVLSWRDRELGANAWELSVTTEAGTTQTVITENPYTMTALQSDTDYRVKIRLKKGDDYSEWTDEVSFTTQEEFMRPTELMVLSLTGTTATLSWKAGSDEETWQIAYSADADFNPETADTKVTASESPFTLNNLTEGTTYYAAIRADYGEGHYSQWTEKVSFLPRNELTVYDGTQTSLVVPLNVYDFNRYTRSQYVIPATDLEDLVGCTITGLKFYTKYDSEFTTDVPVDIYLAEVNESSISNYVDKSDATIVYQGTVSMVLVDRRGEVTITFTTPYLYKGGNLLVGSENTLKGTFKKLYFYGVEVLGASIAGSNYSDTGSFLAGQQNFIPKTTIFYWLDNAAVKMPYHLTASNVTYNSAVLNWRDRELGANAWELSVTTEAGTIQTVITENPYTMTALQSDTDYRVKIRLKKGDEYSEWTDEVSFTTQEEFMRPTELMVHSLTGTTATLSWKAGSDEETWQIAYSTDAEFNPETAGTKVTASESPFTLNNLTEGTTYYAAIRADYGEGHYSQWTQKVRFVPRDELTVYEGAETNWHVPLNVYDFEKYTRSQFVIPATDLEDLAGCIITGLKFYINYDSEFTTDVPVDIYLTEVNESSISNYVDKSDATIVYQGTVSTVPVDQRGEVTIIFTTPYLYKGGNLLVGSENTSKGTYKLFSFYGVEVLGASIAGSNISDTGSISAEQQNFIPKTTIFYQLDNAAVKMPYHLTAFNVANNTAVLSWRDRDPGADTWELSVTTETETTQTVITENPYTMTSLQSDTDYRVKIRLKKGNEYSQWTDEVSFTTMKDNTKRMIAAGDWNDADNWIPAGLPTWNDAVYLDVVASVPAGVVAKADKIILLDGGSLIVKDGGQLKVHYEVAQVTMEKLITGYGSELWPWRLISHPMRNGKEFELSEFSSSPGTAQVYRFLPTQDLEWKRNSTTNFQSLLIFNSFMYANEYNDRLLFTGLVESTKNPNEGKTTLRIVPWTYDGSLTYDYNGWVAVGNPYACNCYLAYVDGNFNELPATFYKLNAAGDEWEVYENRVMIAPCEGVLMQCKQNGNIAFFQDPPRSNWTANKLGTVAYPVLPNPTVTTDQDASVKVENDIELYDWADNSDILESNDGKMVNATISGRKLYYDNTWNTLCLPFSLTADHVQHSALAGANIKELDVTGDYTPSDIIVIGDNYFHSGFVEATGELRLYFKDATYIESGKPYVVKKNGRAITFTATAGTQGYANQGYNCMLDATANSNGGTWCAEGRSGQPWFVEFSASTPIYVTQYTLTTGSSVQAHPEQNPMKWILYGKRYSGDEWTVIDARNSGAYYTDALPDANGTDMDYSIAIDKRSAYQFFRLEISVLVDGNVMQLGEIKFKHLDEVENLYFPAVSIRKAAPTPVTTIKDGGKLSFQGIYNPLEIATNDRSLLFLAEDNNLYYPTYNMNIGAFRAYYKLNGITAGNISQVRLLFDGETETAIEEIAESEPAIREPVIGWYTLDGRKLDSEPTKRGVYIKDGKKVIVNKNK